MPMGALIAGGLQAGGSILGSLFGSQAQTSAANNALNMQQQMWGQAMGFASPFINAGQSVLPTLQKLLTPGADMNATLSQLPGFKFAQDWGQWGVTNQGTTRGLGGNVLRAGADYATGLASNTWGNLVNQLQGFANMGSSAAGGLVGAAQGFGSNMSGIMQGIGNVQGGAINNIFSSLGGLGNSYMSGTLLSKLLGGGNASNIGPINPNRSAWNPVGMNAGEGNTL